MDGIIRSTGIPKKFRVEELDFISEGVSLTVGKEDRIKTKFGAFLSLLVYTVLILATIYYTKKFIETEDPKIQYNMIVDSTSNKINLEDSDLYFFLFIQNPKSVPVESFPTEDFFNNPTFDDYENFNPNDFTNPDTSGAGDPGITRRVLQTGTTKENYFLSTSNLDSYFTYSLQYKVAEYTSSKTGEIFEQVNIANKTLIPCKEAAWFSDKQFREVIEENSFAKEMINQYGLCFNINKGVSLFGDSMTKKSGFLNFILSVCDETAPGATNCLGQGNIFNILEKNDGIKIILGALDPSVNNTKKFNPFSWALNIENSFKIDGFLRMKANVAIKKIEAITDHGWVIENKKSLQKGALHSVNLEFSSKFRFGTQKATQADGRGEFFMTTDTNSEVFEISFGASRVVDQFTRSYDTVLDLFGNIGGSIEFVILLIVLSFHWHENYTTSTRVRKALSDHLKLPSQLSQRETSIFGLCCKKTQPIAKDALDEILEDALSIEKLAEQSISCDLLYQFILEPEIIDLAPTIAVMSKAIEIKEQEKKEEEAKAAKKENRELGGSAKESEEKVVDLKQAYQKLLNLEPKQGDRVNGAIKQKYLQVIEDYRRHFELSSVDECFQQDESRKPHPKHIEATNIQGQFMPVREENYRESTHQPANFMTEPKGNFDQAFEAQKDGEQAAFYLDKPPQF